MRVVRRDRIDGDYDLWLCTESEQCPECRPNHLTEAGDR